VFDVGQDPDVGGCPPAQRVPEVPLASANRRGLVGVVLRAVQHPGPGELSEQAEVDAVSRPVRDKGGSDGNGRFDQDPETIARPSTNTAGWGIRTSDDHQARPSKGRRGNSRPPRPRGLFDVAHCYSGIRISASRSVRPSEMPIKVDPDDGRFAQVALTDIERQLFSSDAECADGRC
jgi:hypothetical protein